MTVYGREKIVYLDASPVQMRMQNEPGQVSDTKLVPVG